MTLVERIRAEAALASRAGQHDRLLKIADELEARESFVDVDDFAYPDEPEDAS